MGKKVFLAAFFIFVLFFSSSVISLFAEDAANAAKDPLPSLKKVALVIAPTNFRDEELTIPLETLKKAGFATLIVSTKSGTATGMLGMTISIEKTIDEISPDELSGLIVVGGTGSPEFLWNNKKLQEVISALSSKGKALGAICLSPAILARAGVLKGKKATTWKSDETLAELEKNGATYVEESCVVAGKVVTGNGPEAAEKFATEMLRLLSEQKNN
ncbi:MAG: DJ-1/PfpI family protein [Candidatus Riflebacteria bacterium]|nr:DJ-1/PfpI family protein [Candidatus Riflebacteria bacterium]